jgi:4-hydroxybenzoate polyprenyltransferase
MRWVDLFVLASLFTLRVLTGGAASGTALSIWLVIFVFAVFLTLADVKRLTALARTAKGARLPGRGYTHFDVSGLRFIAITAVLAAISAFVIYTFSVEASTLYTHPHLLRLVSIPMGIWLVRMVYLSQKGEEDYDPIVFVAHDRVGHLIIAAGVFLAYLAI